MKTMWRFLLALASLSLFLGGCGGGGSSSYVGETPKEETTLTGVASKGPIREGTIEVFSLDADGSVGDLLGSAVTAADGTFTISLGNFSGNILVKVTGGTYIDEATGEETANTSLRAGVVGLSGDLAMAVTPLTEIAVQLAGENLTGNIEAANATVSALLGGANIITTLPVDITNPASSGSDPASRNYGLLLAAVAKLVADGTFVDVDATTAAIAGDLTDNLLDLTGKAVSSAVGAVIADPQVNQGGIEADTPIVSIIESYTSSSIASPSRLQGTYRLFAKDKIFWEFPVGDTTAVIDTIYGGHATVTFNGAGGCSIQYAGSDFERDGQSVSAFPESGASDKCSYTVSATGEFTVIMIDSDGSDTFSGWVSADGNALFSGEVEVDVDPGGKEYVVSLMTGVKTGTAMNAASLSGTFQLFAIDSIFWEFPVGDTTAVTDTIYGGHATATFDGAGGCSIQYAGSDFERDGQKVSAFPESGASDKCSYTVSATGEFTVTMTDADGDDTFSGWISADGNSLLSGEVEVDVDPGGKEYVVSLMTGVKTGTAMNAASLSGTFRLFAIDSIFWEFPVGDTTAVNDTIYGGHVTATFDGKGECSLQYAGSDFERDGQSVSAFPESGASDKCSYTVSATGEFTVTTADADGDDTFSGWISADGNSLLSGEVHADVETGGKEYVVSLMTGVKAD